MCGICGWAACDINRPFDPAVLRRMTRAIAHRGPDGEGYFEEPGIALGHRRLGAIDIERGGQPFFSPSGRYVVVNNGDIYNASQLRAFLQSKNYPFHTRCVTEVIAVLAEHCGFEFVNQLEGIFAFALWDKKEKRLLLARDGLGIKPLLYRIDPDGIRFASEAKALYVCGMMRWTINSRALHHYLGLNYIPAPFSIHEEVQKLQPGETLIWQAGKVKKSKFWTPPAQRANSYRPQEVGATVRALVNESVRGQLQNDVPVGVFLSSGIDSAVILKSACDYSTPKPEAFCVGFEEKTFDERPGARQTARIVGAHLTEFILKPNLQDLLQKMAEHFDEPFADSSAVPVWELCRQTSRHVKVALSGEGGDEVFCGYEPYHAHLYAMRMKQYKLHFFAPAMARLLKMLPASDRKTTRLYKLIRFLPHLSESHAQRHFLWKVIFNEEQKRRLYTKEWENSNCKNEATVLLWENAFNSFNGQDPISAAALADMSLYLPNDVLKKVDISSMAHSLEVRVPLLDRRIIEFVAPLPDLEKIDMRRKKKPLRAAFENSNLRPIFHRPKQGFSIPAAKWLKVNLKKFFRDAVNDPAFKKSFGIIDVSEVMRLYRQHEQKREDLSRQLWGLLMLALWCQKRPI